MRPVICPHCGQKALWDNNPFRPFCSERCRLIDLGQWVEGGYRIPSPDSLQDEDLAELEKAYESLSVSSSPVSLPRKK